MGSCSVRCGCSNLRTMRLVRRGEPGDCMHFIASGEVEIEVGPAPLRLGPGEFFGEIALLTGTPRDGNGRRRGTLHIAGRGRLPRRSCRVRAGLRGDHRFGASANAQEGSVTVTAVTLAPISLARAIPYSTALAARHDSSVGNSIF